MEDASGEGEQEFWFGEGGCLELSEMESWELERLLLECGKSGHPIYGDKAGSKWDDDDDVRKAMGYLLQQKPFPLILYHLQ